MPLHTVKKSKLQQIVFITINSEIKTMDSNFLQHYLRGDIYFTLNVVNFQLTNERLVSFDRKDQHSIP